MFPTTVLASLLSRKMDPIAEHEGLQLGNGFLMERSGNVTALNTDTMLKRKKDLGRKTKKRKIKRRNGNSFLFGSNRS